MKIRFWGAVGTVTGSMHEVIADDRRYLLDCGLYQGRRKEARERNRNFPFAPESVDALILSHAHIDHSGNIPTLVRRGFEGPIYATPAASDLCSTMLRDSAYIQEKDAKYMRKRRSRRRRIDASSPEPVEPLYTLEDAEDALEQFREVGYHKKTRIDKNLTYEAFDAGHMLGSSSVVLRHRRGSKSIRLGFSGDIGRKEMPIIRDPETLPPVDYLIMESTYGGRLHAPRSNVAEKLAKVINQTARGGGRVVVPAFSVGRTQQLVLMLHELTLQKKIPEIPIYVDSPLAVNATEVYRRHTECYDKETLEHLMDDRDPFAFKRLRYTRNVGESKALNDVRFPYVVISASGMCEAGRILHHLRNSIEDPRNSILITGYQAAHTLGRKLVDRMHEVPIFGEPMRRRANVFKLNEMSGHADQQEMLTWLRPIAEGLKKIFLVHGERDAQKSLAYAIESLFDIEVVLPEYGETFELG